MTYLQKKKLAFMSIVNKVKGFVRTVTGIPPLTLLDCVDGNSIINYTISGNSVQDGTPTPDAPIDIVSVGELVTDENDVNYGKYKITVKVSDGNNKSITTNIYLNEPLRKVDNSVGTYAEQIDYENQKIVNPALVTVTLTGNESWGLRSEKTNTFQYWYGTAVNGGICSHYGQITPSDLDNMTGIVRLVNTAYFIISDLNCSSVAEFKAFLKAQYNNGTPVTILTRKNSGGTTEKAMNLPKLPTFKGTTVYSIDTTVQPSNMSATYYSTSKGD